MTKYDTALRSCLNCDWVDLDVEEMWNILKLKTDSGVKQFITVSSRFYSTKWKRPLKVELCTQDSLTSVSNMALCGT